MILNYLITCLLAGLATYGLSETVTDEDGPFQVFTRLRFWLIPIEIRPIPFQLITKGYATICDMFVGNEPFIDDLENELNAVDRLLEYDQSFNNSLKGSLFNILNCRYCFGVWAAHILNPLLFLAFFGFTGANFALGVLLSFVAVAFQRLIISYSNKR